MYNLEELANHAINREFRNIRDKSGEPYVYHLRYVAEKASCLAWLEFNDAEITELCYIVGLLHDLVEDIPYWDIQRVKEVFDEEIAQNVDNLTKRKHESHEDYLERVKSSKISTLVKIADSGHNSDITRFKNFDSFTEEKQKKIIEKSIFYVKQKADLIEFLLNTENNMKLLCPHNTFESLTLTNERGRTVQYMCSKCKMWFTPREHRQIQKLKD